MAGKITRRDFVAAASAVAVASYAREHLVLAAQPAASKLLASSLAPARSGRWMDVARNRVVYQSSSADDDHTGHLVTDGSTLTYWKSRAEGEQWIAVDLGRTVQLDRLSIHWGETRARTYRIEVSTEAGTPQHWTTVHDGTAAVKDSDVLPLKSVIARHIRLIGNAGHTGLSVVGLEAWSADNKPLTPITRQMVSHEGATLARGWVLQCSLFTKSSAEQIASPEYAGADWIPAVVPATVLSSYLAADAIPDPYFGNQVAQLSDGFFTGNDFWYRNCFSVSPSCKGRRLWLVFEGINWKAEVHFNGRPIGQIDGAFIRGRFDITELAVCGGMNCVAVCIQQLAHPGVVQHKTLGHHYRNGGVLGLDSPTFVASIGWNWMPTIPGRNTGIWNEVRFETSGDGVLVDPWVTSELSNGNALAKLTVKTEVSNCSAQPLACVLHLSMNEHKFHLAVELQPHETRLIHIDQAAWAALAVENPRLWWPNGYGERVLHAMKFAVECNGTISDEKTVTFGIRTMEYQTDGGILHILVNGHRILCRGGNWGMDDATLNCDRKGYDVRVAMHRDANLNMIRNWVGMVGRDDFYDACDRHGVLIWDDFWLANPGDGPDPIDHAMFLRNAADKVRRVRRHASLALYCGRNEGMPPADLDQGMQKAIAELDGTRYYIPASDRGLVTGHGPYENQDPEWYFANRGVTFHSEQGIVCVPPVESMRAMMPEKDLWPVSDMWAVHDYQEPRSPLYTARIESRYGKPEGIEDYCRKAQMVNLESAKAMFECLQSRQGAGMLVWMTQSAWPALICQLYDYYFEQTAAFFGAKAACEPVHILWDPTSNLVKAANNTVSPLENLRAEAWIYDFDGREQGHQTKVLNVPAASAGECFALTIPDTLDRVRFIRLLLSQPGGVLSENFYWSPATAGDCRDLVHLKETRLSVTTHTTITADAETIITVTVANPNPGIALATRLKLLRAGSEQRILPAFYEDNYFSLVPHQQKTLRVRMASSLLEGKMPRLSVSGWNIHSEIHPCAR